MVRSPETDENSGNKESNEDLLAQANPWQEAALENEAAESLEKNYLQNNHRQSTLKKQKNLVN